MYYNRVLTAEETLYVSRAQQKIATLAVELATEYAVNDVDEYKAQLILELEYSINSVKSSLLDWSPEEIRMMTDYYSLQGELVKFSFRSVIFQPVNPVTGDVYATLPQLRTEEDARVAQDAVLLALIQQEIQDRTDADDALLAQIQASNGGLTTVEITVSEDIGGIKAGTVYPIGTSLEDIFTDLFSLPATISNLSFTNYAALAEVGVGLGVTVGEITFGTFTWDVQGTPVNLVLNGPGFTNVPVTGNSFVTPVTITADPGNYQWTLSGDNVDPITLALNVIYQSYYGKEATADDTPVTVTEAKILAGIGSLQLTADEVTISADTTAGEQGFIAVPKAQTVTSYTNWFVDNTNFSDIVSGEFITTPTDVTVNGVVYEVYRWGYRSPLVNDIKLHR